MKHNYTIASIEDVLGERMLDAVGYIEVEWTDWTGSVCTEQALAFRLDGIVYAALEDPSDGYRSAMEDLITGDFKLSNTFKPVEVVVEGYQEDDEDTMKIVDVVTGKTVIEVGTDYSEDYYPRFIAYWDPTGLVHNQ